MKRTNYRWGASSSLWPCHRRRRLLCWSAMAPSHRCLPLLPLPSSSPPLAPTLQPAVSSGGPATSSSSPTPRIFSPTHTLTFSACPSPASSTSLCSLVNPSVRVAVSEMRIGMPVPDKDDLAVTALVRGGASRDSLDVFVHAGAYAPLVFGETGARVAVVCWGRNAAAAKTRKGIERMRPPGVTELLLTNDGDRIFEGSVTNFFVVYLKALAQKFEVQTAPISDGVLPGIIRQIVIEVCHDIGIPVREVSPSWSKREFWQEAFVTSSLRLIGMWSQFKYLYFGRTYSQKLGATYPAR